MITDLKAESYIESLIKYNSDLCEDIGEEAVNSDVPIIRRSTESFLKFVLEMKKPKNILEVGTAVAYSTILMAENTASDTFITTIEKFKPRILLAKENIKRAALNKRINLLEGDAASILKRLVLENKKFDFIFMDAAKAQYINWLPDILKLMECNALLLSDNVLQDGDVAGSKYALVRRNRSIYSRMRKYLYEITHNDLLSSAILPVGDGIALSMRR